MIITNRMIRAISLLLVASSAISVLSSPVDKDLGEAYVPVEIQADEQPQTGYTSTLVPSIPAATDTLSKSNDEGDEEGLASTIPSDEEQFPTPLPFLDEPEEASFYIPSPPSRGTLTPPNFDINKVPGITGTKDEQHTPIFVGRQACKCGVSGDRRYSQFNDTKVQGREQFNGTKIVGGEPASIENYPWTIALLRRNWLGLVNDRPYCGGTLINNLYIATASHCVDGMSPRGIVAAMHEEDVTSTTESASGTQRIEIAKIIMHPQYNRRTIDNDIALLRLAQPVELGKVMIPACLPANNDHSFENFTATAAGWGAVKESGSTSNILRKVDVPVIPNMECNTKTKYKGKITDNMICAGFPEGGKDSCQGDSGGPLTIENGERLTLIGIVSWGYGCARPDSPGVYTRVARYPEWVVENSKDAEWCLD